jgi:hypothetical protein
MSAVYNIDGQFVRIEKVLSSSSSWSFPVLRARIQVVGGNVDADHRIIARLFAMSSSVGVRTQDTELNPSAEWQTIDCRLDVPQSSPPLDLTAVQSYGVELHVSAGSSGTSWSAQQTTALVDSFELVDPDVTN